MFESITVNRRLHPMLKQPFSIGHIAECLLFYDKVNIITSPTELEQLIRICGVENLLNLLTNDTLQIHLNISSFGSTQAPNTQRIGFGVMTQVNNTIESTIYKSVQNVYKNSHKSKEFQLQLLPFIKPYNYDNLLLEKYLTDSEFTSKAFREVVKQNFPEYPIPLDLVYKLYPDEPRHFPYEMVMEKIYDIDTNFEINIFEKELRNRSVEMSQGFGVTFMMSVAGAIQDIEAAAYFRTEISTEELSTPIIQNAIRIIDSYIGSKEKHITEFNEFVVRDFPSLSDTINSGRRSFDDFMDLIERSKQFKGWLKEIPADFNVVSEYIKANEIKSFSDSNLYKVLKFVLISTPLAFANIPIIKDLGTLKTGIDLVIGTVADTASDYFTKKFDTWKPNQFVQNDLNEFINE